MKGKSPLFAGSKRSKLPDGISRSQKNRIERGYRKIDDHLKDLDISGAIRDIKGNPVINPFGKPYQHYKEVDEAIEGLKKDRNSLIKSIQNPNLTPEIRKSIQDTVNEFDLYINNWNKIKGENENEKNIKRTK